MTRSPISPSPVWMLRALSVGESNARPTLLASASGSSHNANVKRLGQISCRLPPSQELIRRFVGDEMPCANGCGYVYGVYIEFVQVLVAVQTSSVPSFAVPLATFQLPP